MEKQFFLKRKKRIATDEDIEIDGGVTKETVTNAPKHIKSTLIIRVTIEMSTVADGEENEYSGYVYNLNAALENGAVKGCYKCRDRYGSAVEQRFRASVKFMSDLYRIVNEYDLARYNGERCFVAGLPDNYGATIDIMFASGERLYASDNETNFIPGNAVKEIVKLFQNKTVN